MGVGASGTHRDLGSVDQHGLLGVSKRFVVSLLLQEIFFLAAKALLQTSRQRSLESLGVESANLELFAQLGHLGDLRRDYFLATI